MDTEKAEFDEWYAKWPRKTARADAWKAWQQTRGVRPTLAELLSAIDRYVQWRKRLAARGDFVPALLYPASWLRGERWGDEFDGEQVPTVVPAPTVEQLAALDARQEERMRVMRARAAWADVTCALTVRSMPLGGWQDPMTAAALDRIGGFGVVCRFTSRSELAGFGREFEKAYSEIDTTADAAGAPHLKIVRRA